VRILISEDDPVSSRVLVATLAKWGHEVVVTRDGLEAWVALQDEAMYEHKRGKKASPNLEALIAGRGGDNVRHAFRC